MLECCLYYHAVHEIVLEDKLPISASTSMQQEQPEGQERRGCRSVMGVDGDYTMLDGTSNETRGAICSKSRIRVLCCSGAHTTFLLHVPAIRKLLCMIRRRRVC